MRTIEKIKIVLAFATVILCKGLKAQVCNGSLGEPVVNVTFGNGTNPGNALKSATTSYTFTSDGCPGDGSYTVVNNTPGCFGATWHNIPEDHTPNDINGYMMLVNASFNPGDFYVDTVNNLCANTTYEFSAWILNILVPGACSPGPIVPNLTFNIETVTGAVLGTYNTGDISSAASPTWKQYGLFFTTPVNTSSVVIRLTNKAPGGCGNDLALDDITFRPCGPSVQLSGSSNITNYDFCVGANTTTTLTVNVGSGYTSPSLQWQQSLDSGITWTDITGAVTSSYIFNKTGVGTYLYRVAVGDGANIFVSSCRIVSNVLTAIIHDIPVVSATNNSPVCEGTSLNLVATGGTLYDWTGPSAFSATTANPSRIATANAAGQYNVVVTDQFGCINKASTTALINSKPTATVSTNKNICEGDSVTLNAGGGTSYLWSPANSLSNADMPTTVAKPADTTTYTIVVTSANNCTDTAGVTVNVFRKPLVSAGPDKIILKGQSTDLKGIASGTNISLFWSPSFYLDNSFIVNPVATPPANIVYTLHAVSNDGCGSATDDIAIKVFNDIYIPSAFSPNNDGLNDVWRIEALVTYPEAQLRIFNRYGVSVFESSGLFPGWDGIYKGKVVPAGAYTYVIELKNNRPPLKGFVVVVR